MAARQVGPMLLGMNVRIVIVAVVLVLFTTFSVAITAGSPDGFFGFVTLALRERWGAQMLADLFLSFTLFTIWMVPDAKKHGVPAWPYVIAVFLLGSIGALAYLLHREIRAHRSARFAPALGR